MTNNRYTIEKRDREVVERFRGIVVSKEQRKKKARIRMAGIFLVIVGIAGIGFWGKLSPSPVKAPVKYTSDVIVLSKIGHTADSPEAGAEIVQQENEQPQPADMPEAVTPVIPEQLSESPAGMTPQETAELRESVALLMPKLPSSDKKEGVAIFVPPGRETDIKVVNIATCRGVKNRQVVSRQDVFSIKKGAAPYVWMDVRSKELPHTLKHVYYLNNQRYCVVPLKITYPRMRTWSTVSLKYPTQVGQWRVDVVSGTGQVLSQVGFEVVP